MYNNFLPDTNGATLRPFRFWCQKVLPLVYDDSLSYYELLCKVVDYLNKILDDDKKLIEAFTQLETFVTDYFNNLDITEEIDAKLDQMVEDGTIPDMIGALVDDYVAEQTEYNMDNPPLHFATNSETAATLIGNVAQTYIQKRDEFTYGGRYTAIRDDVHQVDGKWELNCSTFAVLLAFGVTYENSAFKRGAGNNKLDPRCCTNLDLWEWFKTDKEGETGDLRFKYSSDLAKYCHERGYCFEPNEDLSNIKTGDIIFLKDQIAGGDASPTYLDIDHTAVFGFWNSNGGYTCWEVGSLPSAQFYSRANLDNNCVLVCRLPFQNVEESFENLALFNGEVDTESNVVDYITIKDLQPGEYYTLVAKLTYNELPQNAYPVVYQTVGSTATRLMGFDRATEKPDDDIYILPFVPIGTVPISLRINLASSSILQPRAHLIWYNVVKGIHFNKERMPWTIRAGFNANDGFTITYNAQFDKELILNFTGTLTPGTNIIGAVQRAITHGTITPVCGICYPSTGVASDVEFCLYNKNLTVRNNSGAAITGTCYVRIPVFSE